MPGEHKDPEDRIEYLSWFEMIERSFDPPLLKGRSRFKETQGWFGVWLIRSLSGFKYKKMSEESFNKFSAIFSSKLQTWLTYLGLGGILGFIEFSNVPNLHFDSWYAIVGYVVIAASLIMSLIANLARMLTISDPYFNSEAYRIFKREEYEMFLPYFKENKYTFKTAQEWVKLLYRENNLDAVIAEHIELHRQNREIIDSLNRNLEKSEQNLRQTEENVSLLIHQIELLQRLAKVNEDGFNSAISTIYRLRSEDRLFNTTDLRVVTDFSLFELEGHYLYRLCEQGTTETPKIIYIDDPNYEHYSSVKLVQGENTIEYATSDREGRTVASYWIEMPSGRILIYNFHYDSTIEDMNDIIETKEMYRYIKGICMHLDERGFLNKEGHRHVAN